MAFVLPSPGVQHKMRTASEGSYSVQLAHPIPDLQSLQGAYVQNVERLQERAERMSVSSDLGEEIRKLQVEQKLSDSRRASLLSNAASEAVHVQRARNTSTSSWSNSIVEVNSAARYGGYSPAGYLTSPIGSLRSGSWSQVSHTMSNPARTMSKTSRLGLMKSAEFDDEFASTLIDDLVLNGSSSIQDTPRQKSKSDSSTSESMDEDTREKRMKRISVGRMPSDGSFTKLYNQLAEANNSSTQLSGVRIASDTSFTDIYDQIAGEIRDTLDTSVIGAQERRLDSAAKSQSEPKIQERAVMAETSSIRPLEKSMPPPPPPPHATLPDSTGDDYGVNFSFASSVRPQPPSEHQTPRLQQHHVPDEEDKVDRPASVHSQDTTQQDQGMFEDFDGTHYAPSVQSRWGSLKDTSGGMFPVEDPRPASVLKMLHPPESMSNLIPPPNDGMVYYPAPVPRLLNLPQRISQMPSAAILARRKTEMLQGLPEDARKSAPWLSHDEALAGPANPRASKMNLSTLPPQLRASVFFDPGTKRQDVEIRDQSAMKTLEDMLDASALAPVSAFTDHPMVGKAGGHVYKRSTSDFRASTLDIAQLETKKKERKGSFLGLRRSSKNSEDMLDDAALEKRLNGDAEGRSGGTTPLPGFDEEHSDADEEDHEEGGVPLEEEYEDENHIGAPTTLLAELELRKMQQKSRNRTAFNAFPNGMHSTLLELDAVAQLEKKKRKVKRVALAWEDPDAQAAALEADDDDEDVPLGMLFGKSKIVQNKLAEQGLADWDRPLGLLERKHLEDSEPLSRRRMRLLGINPNAVPPPVAITNPPESESEHEGETLGQRRQRLKEKKALDATLGDLESRPASRAFSAECMSQFGVEAMDGPKPKKTIVHIKDTSGGSQAKSPGLAPPNRSGATTPGSPAVDGDEEETLGQRRARLAREKQRNPVRQSTMPIHNEARLSYMPTLPTRQSQLSLNPEARMSYFPAMPSPQMMVPQQQMMMPPQQMPQMRHSHSMADLLAATPVGRDEPRKVSNEMLMAAMPQGSLLAVNAENDAAKKARMRLSSAEHLGNPRPAAERQYSAAYVQAPAWQQGGYAGMSQSNLLQGINGVHPGNMSTPNLVRGYAGQGVGGIQMGTPGGYAQRASVVAREPEVVIDPKTRDRVSEWRLSVQGGVREVGM